jgi:LPXTG-motif cell wall-anchored protein
LQDIAKNGGVAPTPAAKSLPSIVPSGATPLASPAPIQATPVDANAATASGPISAPVLPAAASSPTNQAVNVDGSTTSSATTDNLLSNILASLSSGGNASSAGTGSGVGASDTSLPSPTAADVAALQPSVSQTSSSGPNVVLIIGIIAVLGLGAYLYFKHKKGSPSE